MNNRTLSSGCSRIKPQIMVQQCEHYYDANLHMTCMWLHSKSGVKILIYV